MLFHAHALAALCALSVVKTTASNSKNEDSPSVHGDTNEADFGDISTGLDKDPFVPKSNAGTKLAKQRATAVATILQNQDVSQEMQSMEASKTVKASNLLRNTYHLDDVSNNDHSNTNNEPGAFSNLATVGLVERGMENKDFDARKELGILDPEQLDSPGTNWGTDNRRLQDTPVDCDTYCDQYGRYVVPQDALFGQLIADKLNQGSGPIGCWNTSLVTDMSYAFSLTDNVIANSFNGPLVCWDTSAVTDMSFMFLNSAFNQPLDSWNTSAVTNMYGMFQWAYAFNQPVNSWDTSKVTNMDSMFSGVKAYFRNTPNLFNQPLDSWNTSAVTSMWGMFYNALAFNQPLDSWNTSAVTYMRGMFSDAESFNQPVDSWDTSAVTDMIGMFSGAGAFNQPVDSWNTSAVTRMSYMFYNATTFNQQVDSWDTSAVADMRYMFHKAGAFNQPLDSWNTSAVTSMESMFYNAPAFNQPLNSWDTSAVTDMRYMFSREITLFRTASYMLPTFNQPLNSWDTSKVTDMSFMFQRATAFNQPLDSWDTSAVTVMRYMFYNAGAFNQPLDSWNTSAVSEIGGMFSDAESFNQPVDSWDTSAVTSMSYMFQDATKFNQPVDSWNVSAVTSMSGMFYNAAAFNQCISTWADKTPDDVKLSYNSFNGIFIGSGCPDKATPSPTVGPWCQTKADGCRVASSCDDAPNSVKFDYVNKKNLTRKSCKFVKNSLEGQKLNLKNKICNLDAKPPARGQGGIPKDTKIRYVCPRACEICPDQCKDSRRTFILDGKPRKCTVLDKKGSAKKKELCNSKVKLPGNNRKPKLKSLCQARCSEVGVGRCVIPSEEINV